MTDTSTDLARPDGHCKSDEIWIGCLRRYGSVDRTDLCGGGLTDMEVAYQTAMIMADEPDYEAKLIAAKDRIRWLSVQFAALIATQHRLREALFITAAHCQGGHSEAGSIAAEVLGVPFPIRMDELEAKALSEGRNTCALWPWLYKMRETRPAIDGARP